MKKKSIYRKKSIQHNKKNKQNTKTKKRTNKIQKIRTNKTKNSYYTSVIQWETTTK